MDALGYYYDDDFRDEMREEMFWDRDDDDRLPAYLRGGMTVSTQD